VVKRLIQRSKNANSIVEAAMDQFRIPRGHCEKVRFFSVAVLKYSTGKYPREKQYRYVFHEFLFSVFPGKAGNYRPTHLAPVPCVMGGSHEASGGFSAWSFIRIAIHSAVCILRVGLPVEYYEEGTPTSSRHGELRASLRPNT
jgi:hypothetical protein